MPAAKKAVAAEDTPRVVIREPRLGAAVFTLVGTSPLMTARFSKKAELMGHMATQNSGKKKERKERNYQQEYEDAKYLSTEGWNGVNAASFRNAAISACRLVNFKMTIAKLSIFTVAEGWDVLEGTPLVRITKGEPELSAMQVRNANGNTDIRIRPVWAPGWEVRPTIKWDMDQFTLSDVTNLMLRVGAQVGIGEGRPDSRSSAGLGYGLFDIAACSQIIGA